MAAWALLESVVAKSCDNRSLRSSTSLCKVLMQLQVSCNTLEAETCTRTKIIIKNNFIICHILHLMPLKVYIVNDGKREYPSPTPSQVVGKITLKGGHTRDLSSKANQSHRKSVFLCLLHVTCSCERENGERDSNS